MSEQPTDELPDDWAPARKKPVVVEAAGPYTDPRLVDTLEGDFEIDDEYLDEHGGYFLIRGVEGEIYPCAADVFHRTYEWVHADDGGQERNPGEEGGYGFIRPSATAELDVPSGDASAVDDEGDSECR